MIFQFLFFLLSFVGSQNLLWNSYSPHLLFSLSKSQINSPEISILYYRSENCISEIECELHHRYNSSLLQEYESHNGEDYFLLRYMDPEIPLSFSAEFSKEIYKNNEQKWNTILDLESESVNFILAIRLRETSHVIKVLESSNYNYLISFGTSSETNEHLRIETTINCNSESSISLLNVGKEDMSNMRELYIREVIFPPFEGVEPDLSNKSPKNVVYFTFKQKGECEYILSFDSNQIPKKIHPTEFRMRADGQRKSFSEKINSIFMSNQLHFPKEIKQIRYDIIHHSLSNLLGGISFYSGELMVVNSRIKHFPKEVFASTPSRNKFPRGFLWDEGFHLLVICKWNIDICTKILSNWFKLMDIEGWIAREQIRTSENAYKVDQRFLEQDFYEGNPPTLLFILRELLNSEIENSNYKDLLLPFYFKIKLWYFWMIETQEQNLLEDDNNNNIFMNFDVFPRNPSFRWHCKGDCHNGNFMGSGLDDYPRQTKETYSKKHLDMTVWITFFAETLVKFSEVLEQKNDNEEFSFNYKKLREKIDEEFLDYSDFIYKDVIFDYKRKTYMHSPHLGYINIFPHLFNFHKKKNEIIDSFFGLLNDSSLLYSKFGIRSLSRSDIHFGKGDDYWRGAIWTPINFLILRSLKLYFNKFDQGILLYEKLKSEFEENLIREFEASGVLWENYCSNTGRGRREKGFTGWTSLIILILNEDYFQS